MAEKRRSRGQRRGDSRRSAGSAVRRGAAAEAGNSGAQTGGRAGERGGWWQRDQTERRQQCVRLLSPRSVCSQHTRPKTIVCLRREVRDQRGDTAVHIYITCGIPANLNILSARTETLSCSVECKYYPAVTSDRVRSSCMTTHYDAIAIPPSCAPASHMLTDSRMSQRRNEESGDPAAIFVLRPASVVVTSSSVASLLLDPVLLPSRPAASLLGLVLASPEPSLLAGWRQLAGWAVATERCELRAVLER